MTYAIVMHLGQAMTVMMLFLIVVKGEFCRAEVC